LIATRSSPCKAGRAPGKLESVAERRIVGDVQGPLHRARVAGGHDKKRHDERAHFRDGRLGAQEAILFGFTDGATTAGVTGWGAIGIFTFTPRKLLRRRDRIRSLCAGLTPELLRVDPIVLPS
jgi:hypothetical protein